MLICYKCSKPLDYNPYPVDLLYFKDSNEKEHKIRKDLCKTCRKEFDEYMIKVIDDFFTNKENI